MYIPLPRAWVLSYKHGKRILPTLAVLAMASLWVAIFYFREREFYNLLLVFLLMGGIVVGGVTSYVTVGTCWRRGSSGVRLSRLRDGMFAVTMWSRPAFTISASLAYAWLGVALVSHPFVMAMIPSSGTRTDAQLRALGYVSTVVGLIFLCFACSRIVRKRGQLGIGLSPEGVYHWSHFGCCFYRWESIIDILPVVVRSPRIELVVVEPAGRQRNPEENFLASWLIFRRRNRRIELHYLDVNPGVVYLAVVFYLRHPELRHELATMEGVQRIQRLDFAEVVDELETTGTLRAMVDRP
ncbi:hypothetical protein DFJ64_0701 [Thermasporomyces composti]|uniref:Uncharacterized protein n=1 Tax=Thermasporomyces composti TaxID=696763 RepID=A0A3D9V8J3_THECX|nr:hypothetical protein DFJ64_0701 [Thermasporomyces composti]